ncbi:MAG TPA: homoserine O-acetyltransferase [Acidobacteriaceae bacterium]|nr:homoserine O-acetyltransferase [Acidobacteriaceae bacterium]
MSSSPSAALFTPSFEGDYSPEEDFSLEAGGMLRSPNLHYAIYGEPNAAGDNVIFITHALSGSARVADWWPRLFAEGGLLQSAGHCVIGINVLGSCYGSTGPGSINPLTGHRYGPDFPLVTISDIVRLQVRLLEKLKIRRLALVMGASIGGMQALELAIQFPELVQRVVSIGAAPLGAMGLGLNHLQRQMIQLDPAWQGGHYQPDQQPRQGLALSRALAVCTYKSSELFEDRFARQPDRSGEDPLAGGRFDVAGYLDYQGERFVERFDANAYLAMTRAMDLFDPVRGYPSKEDAFRRIEAEVMLVGISSDWLFPAAEIAALAASIEQAGVRCQYRELVSSHGHDAFLAEPDDLARLVRPFLK